MHIQLKQNHISSKSFIISQFIILNKELCQMGRKRDKQKQIQQRRQMRKNDRDAKKMRRKKMGSGDIFKMTQEYIQYYEQFQNQLAILGLKLRDVGGDGNCLFRAIGDHIDGNQNTHMVMRDEACKYILKQGEFFQNYLDEDEDGTVEQYAFGMRKNGEWGGHLQIQALAQCFKAIIVVHKKNMQEYYVTPILNEPLGTIMHLAYFQTQDFEHYLSIRHVNDFTNQPAINQLQQFNNNMYQHLLYGYDPQQAQMMKQFEGMQLNFEKQEQPQVLEQPYPNYPKNKKCKCGSKQSYKTCCFKTYQKKLANKAKKEMY